MNIFKQFVRSIYSPKDIASFRNVKIGRAILYIFLLSVIATLPIVISIATFINKGLEEIDSTFTNELPDFSIQGGTLTTDVNEPVIIEKEDDFTIILDSTGTVTTQKVEEYGNSIALLQKDMVVNMDGTVDTFSYAVMEMDISKAELQDVIQSIDSLKTMINVLIFVVFYIMQAAGAFIKVSILGLVALILKSTMNLTINYGQAWKISAFAITLPTLLAALLSAFAITIPFAGVINWILLFVMLYLSLKEIKEDPIA